MIADKYNNILWNEITDHIVFKRNIINGKLTKTIKTTSTGINFGNNTGLKTVNIPIPEALKGKTILSNTWVLESAYGASAITTAIPFGSTSAITSSLLINNTQPYNVVAYVRWFYID